MANFGFSRLAVVAPYEEHWREAQSAVGAETLLQNARMYATLGEAVGNCTLVIGTGTLTYRKPEQPVVSLPDLHQHVGHALSTNGRIALVFGPEKHGLTRDDLSYCHALIEVPTDPRQPSMNLGQAVAVCLYELARHAGTRFPRNSTERAGHADSRAEAAATSGALDRLAGLIEETMTAAGYSPRAMQPA